MYMHMYVSFSSNAICIDLCTLVIAKAPSLQSLLSGRTFVFSLGSLLKKQELPKNLPQSHSPNAAACGYLPEQEATSLGTEEYNEVVLSVGNIADPDKISSSNRKRGNYNNYSLRMRAKTGKYARENVNL